jgi:hypothetical protein
MQRAWIIELLCEQGAWIVGRLHWQVAQANSKNHIVLQ